MRDESEACRLLKSLDEIREYCGISEALFRKFHANGLPARKIDGRWFAHTENIDRYFQMITRAPAGRRTDGDRHR